MNDILEDKNTYRKVREDPTSKLQRTNNNIVQELFKKEYITKWEKFRLTSNCAVAPELYGLPKVHKDCVPLRPISSSMKVPCYGLAQYVGKLLKNLESPTYNVKNSMEVKEKIKDVILEKDDIIVSFDVVSLFTNIPTHLAIKIIMGKWDKLKEYTKIPKQKILQILQFCLNDNNYFKQDDTFYHQTYGMPMGNPLSPTIANIVLDNLLDEVILELNSKNIKIKLITKYVDDLLAIINKDDEQEIMKLLNSYHTKIQFTIEKEKTGKSHI
ncbi:uncharacterized protein LOC142231244 [Haematobia irritans]|uniref:uncharacterized protein LOC142231244 n=1 Tax=Haematobia irritans TaxID=7368 RepID=UPI003F50ACFA